MLTELDEFADSRFTIKAECFVPEVECSTIPLSCGEVVRGDLAIANHSVGDSHHVYALNVSDDYQNVTIRAHTCSRATTFDT